MDNLVTGAAPNIAHLVSHPHFRFVQHDVTRYINIDDHLDAVLHFASPASPDDYLKLPIPTLKAVSYTHLDVYKRQMRSRSRRRRNRRSRTASLASRRTDS